jgi:hypothetical protein
LSPKVPRRSTVPRAGPPKGRRAPPPPKPVKPAGPPLRDVTRVIGRPDSSLLDVLDNLLNRGVVVNADIILALANVDLVYLRLFALLSAADRVLPRHGRR